MPLQHQPRKERLPYPRKRERPRGYRNQRYTKVGFNVNGTGYVVYTDLSGSFDLVGGRVMEDWVVPGFAAKRDRGEIVNNPMSSTETSYEVGSSGVFCTYKDGTTIGDYLEEGSYIVNSINMPVMSPVAIDIENIINYTMTNALAKCRTSGMKGIVALAEMKKTLRMLTHPLDAIHSLLEHIWQVRQAGETLRVEKINGEVRSINGRKVYRGKAKYQGPGRVVGKPQETLLIPISEAISGSVLANNLGLRPLLMDLEAFLKDIPQAHQEERLTFRSTAEETQTDSVSSAWDSGFLHHTLDTATTHKVTVRSNVMIRDKLSAPLDFGVSLHDIPDAGWELIPFSFLVDYVVNVGDVLGAWRAVFTQEILSASTVYTVDSQAVRQVSDCTTSDSRWTVVSPPTGADTTRIITKVREVGVRTPKLAILPGIKMVTPSHIQNSLSLIVQRLTGIEKPGKFKRTPFF